MLTHTYVGSIAGPQVEPRRRHALRVNAFLSGEDERVQQSTAVGLYEGAKQADVVRP